MSARIKPTLTHFSSTKTGSKRITDICWMWGPNPTNRLACVLRQAQHALSRDFEPASAVLLQQLRGSQSFNS